MSMMAVMRGAAPRISAPLLQDDPRPEKADDAGAVARSRSLRYRAGKGAAMRYVERILQPGEEIRFAATIHWITYVPGFFFLIVALVILVLAQSGERTHGFWLAVAAIVAAIAGILILRAWFDRWITEIAVTNRRVIYKTGFIRRDTNEMEMDKVESVRVDQSILGRLLDYGNVTVMGTGSGFETIRTIARPLDLRNQITGT
jgi:hypothetical protein